MSDDEAMKALKARVREGLRETPMSPEEVISAYVADIARYLPEEKRNDVALELRALLADDLAGRAGDTGRESDEAMALDLVRNFGRPSEVAARYHPPLILVEPADTRAFLVIGAIGLMVSGMVGELGQGYFGANTDVGLKAALSWVVFLLAAFAIKAQVQRTPPRANLWKPALRDYDKASLASAVANALIIVFVIVAYLEPIQGAHWVVGWASGRRVDEVEFAYTESFQHWTRMAWIPLLLAVHGVCHLIAGVRGRWTRDVRVADIMATCILVLQIGWHLRNGEIFVSQDAEQAVRPIMVLLATWWTIEAGIQTYRELGRVTLPKGLPAV